MKKLHLIFIFLSLFSVHGLADTESSIKKVVYDLTTGNIETLNRRLIGSIISNNAYYESRSQKYKVKVIVHGDAYTFFMQDGNHSLHASDKTLVNKKNELEKKLHSLITDYGVQFEVCGAGIKYKRLNPKAFYPFVTIIHSAIVGLVDAQNSGYAYIPIP